MNPCRLISKTKGECIVREDRVQKIAQFADDALVHLPRGNLFLQLVLFHAPVFDMTLCFFVFSTRQWKATEDISIRL